MKSISTGAVLFFLCVSAQAAFDGDNDFEHLRACAVLPGTVLSTVQSGSGGPQQKPTRLVADTAQTLSASEFRKLRQDAEAGDPEAQFALGDLYAEGEAGPQDDAEAVRWFRKAADQGNARAQSNLGVMFDNGRGVAQDKEAAIRWYRKAADQGDESARTLLELSLADACHRDDQCVLVYGCGDAAVNRSHLTQFPADTACSLASKHNPNASARCLDGQCRALDLACHDDNQCAVVWNGCEDIAVKAENRAPMQPAVGRCARPTPHDPARSAQCLKRQCALNP